MSLDYRTHPQPEPLDADLQEWLESAAARAGASLDGALWWHNPASPQYRLAQRYWPDATEADIAREPFDFDQALRETMVCRGCQAHEMQEGGGYADCPLWSDAWEGNPMHPGGSKNWYMVWKALDRGERHEWRKRKCASREKRRLEIEKPVDVGGITGSYVDDYDAGTVGGKRVRP